MLKYFFIISLFLVLSYSPAQVVEDFAGRSVEAGYLDTTNSLNALFNNPHGIDIAQDGTIYIADRFNHVIRKIDTLGVVTTLAGTGEIGDNDGIATEATFNEPWDVCAGNNGEVYVADAKNNKIRIISSAGVVTTYAGSGSAGFTDSSEPLAASFFWPSGLEFDHESEQLYVAGHLSHLIRLIEPDGRVTTYAGVKEDFPNNFGSIDGLRLQAKFYRPYGIHLGSNNELYIADEWNDQIRVIDTNGIVSTLGGQPDTPGYLEGGKDSSLFNFPWDVTTDFHGNVYVIDGYNNVIRTINPETGISSFFAGTPGVNGYAEGFLNEAQFNGATGIEYYDGSLYILDAFNHVVRIIKLLEEINVSLSDDLENANFCAGDSISVNAEPQYYDKYYWYDGSEIIAVTTVPILDLVLDLDQEITVQGERTGIGFANSDTLSMAFEELTLEITATPLSSYCLGDSVLLSVNDDRALWNTGEVGSEIIVKQSGTYSFEIVENKCAEGDFETTVEFIEPPILSVDPAYYELNPGDSIDVTVEGTDLYFWSNGSNENTLSIDTISQLSVVGQDAESMCFSDTSFVTIELFDTNLIYTEMFFPDAFSPNEDGSNDTFEILGGEYYIHGTLEVYNRWGQLLYKNEEYNNDWKGTNNNNEDLVEGTYFYVYTASYSHEKFNGHVYIKR